MTTTTPIISINVYVMPPEDSQWTQEDLDRFTGLHVIAEVADGRIVSAAASAGRSNRRDGRVVGTVVSADVTETGAARLSLRVPAQNLAIEASTAA